MKRILVKKDIKKKMDGWMNVGVGTPRLGITALGYNLTLLVCSQNTLGTTMKLKCFSSLAHLSEFLASFSKSSS